MIWLSSIHNWSTNVVDLQRPDWICPSSLSTFKLTSCIQIRHILWRIESLLTQANMPLRASTGSFLSIESPRDSKLRQLLETFHPFSRFLFRCEVYLLAVLKTEVYIHPKFNCDITYEFMSRTNLKSLKAISVALSSVKILSSRESVLRNENRISSMNCIWRLNVKSRSRNMFRSKQVTLPNGILH